MKLFFATGMLLITTMASSQIIERKKEEIKTKSEQRAENKSSETIDKGLDKIEKGIGSIFKKKDKKKKKEENDPAANTDTQINSSGSGDIPDFTPYKASDFTPGQHVLFFEDFSSGTAAWDLNEWDPNEAAPPGIATISTHPGNWYKLPRKGNFFPVQLADLPDEFTLEYDLFADLDIMSEMEGGIKVIFVESGEDRKEFSFHFNPKPQIQLDVHPSDDLLYVSAIREYGPDERELFKKEFKNAWQKGIARHISISRKHTQISLYIDGKKYLDLPEGLPSAGKYTMLFSTNLWGDGLYFTNIRLAAGSPNAKTEIGTSGKFVTNSIYFDVNSSRIQPASWPTLKTAAAAIESVTGTVLIAGHTDSDGNDELNLTLSQKRAEAVKTALIKEFGIPAERLITEGKGETEPLEPNTTNAGKAKNRRVEFIKQ